MPSLSAEAPSSYLDIPHRRKHLSWKSTAQQTPAETRREPPRQTLHPAHQTHQIRGYRRLRIIPLVVITQFNLVPAAEDPFAVAEPLRDTRLAQPHPQMLHHRRLQAIRRRQEDPLPPSQCSSTRSPLLPGTRTFHHEHLRVQWDAQW